MEIDSALAIIESLKSINSTLEKITQRIEVLESDYKERYLKWRFFRWLITFYPLLLISLVFIIDLDHQKITEVVGDMNELMQDTKSLTVFASDYQD